MTLPPGSSHSPIPAVPPTPEALHSLITSIPAKTLHAYLLDNISAAPPDTLAALASFFAALSPPPLLHCVRCHKDYIDVENGDHSCCIPHDEDNIDIEHVGWGRGNSEYETTYDCCNKTVEGEGDEGPPDGWCYEGMHTVSQVKSIVYLRASHPRGVETIIHIANISPISRRTENVHGSARIRQTPMTCWSLASS
jgi:hypothetical protein